MIYPINEMIENLLASAVDEDTGELLLTDEELEAKLGEIRMEFDDKIEVLRNEYIHRTAEAEALKEERKRLGDRQKRAEASADRVKRFLAYLLKGEKFERGAVKISYRKSEELVVDDGFIEWADENRRELLKITPEVRKADVKRAIKSGEVFEFAHIEQKNNIQVR